MKTMHFDISSQIPQVPLGQNPAANHSLIVRGLDAYAISYAFLQINGIVSFVDGQDARIQGDTLYLTNFSLDHHDNVILQIYYHGIREYILLFPSVLAVDPSRAERMGKFYLEAETCFDQGAWLSFMLMSAAIFEHLLYTKLQQPNGTNTLHALNNRALNSGAISQHAYDVIKNTNTARNVIHCNKMSMAYISRAQAMDAKTVIDELMRSF